MDLGYARPDVNALKANTGPQCESDPVRRIIYLGCCRAALAHTIDRPLNFQLVCSRRRTDFCSSFRPRPVPTHTGLFAG